MVEVLFFFWIFSYVLWENVFRPIDVSAEFEVVDFSNVSFIQIFSNEKLEKSFIWRNESQFLHDSSELFTSDMA
jgi:hypothetical protein